MNGFEFSCHWEALEGGSQEERATFCELGIRFDQVWLTEGRDRLSNVLKNSPYLSAYDLAWWLLENWWRIRWEPKNSQRFEWEMSHCISSIGNGYIWPNITFASDGHRLAVSSKSTQDSAESHYRYVNDFDGVLPWKSFEKACDLFIESVLERLKSRGIRNSDLKLLWDDIRSERANPKSMKIRKIEALLGYDPAGLTKDQLALIEKEIKKLGEDGVDEVAATAHGFSAMPTAKSLSELALSNGIDQSLEIDAVFNYEIDFSKEAWVCAEHAVRELRAKLGVDRERIDDNILQDCLGVSSLSPESEIKTTSPFSFAIANKSNSRKLVLDSKWHTGRRFAAARLIADGMAFLSDKNFQVATSTATYRQKFQRAFAAEFLCPIDALEEYLGGNLSTESQENAAVHFGVSPITVSSILANHGLIQRHEMSERSGYGNFGSAA